MARVSPLNELHEHAEATFSPWGSGAPGDTALVVECYGPIETEYAAIRRGCAILDQPHRGTLVVTGADRFEFLNRMVTQELKGMEAFQSRRSFWLNRKGRIDADLRLMELGERMLIDVDVLQAAGAAKSLTEFVFAEEIEIRDESEHYHRLALHGVTAAKLLALASEHRAGAKIESMKPGDAAVVGIAQREVIVERQDSTGDPGFELTVEVQHAREVYEAIVGAAEKPEHAPMIRLKRAGWHAWNIARIEAGVPVFHIDFGTRSLPHETGVLDDRVSFKKGCYLGQEVVARTQSLGHPRQVLRAIRIEAKDAPTPQHQPGERAQVFASDGSDAAGENKPVGIVTSCTRSPMCGDAVVCFAPIKWGHHEPGKTFHIETNEGRVAGKVQEELVFWRR